MASKKKVLKYIEENIGESAEFQINNDTLYIKFDFLPFKLREFIHAQPDYDQSKMILLPRECQCGHAYFYDEKHFFALCERITNFNF